MRDLNEGSKRDLNEMEQQLLNAFPTNVKRILPNHFKTYENKAETTYNKEENAKEKERGFFIALINLVMNFGTVSSVFFWTLDAVSMSMSNALVHFFGRTINGIHVPNPGSEKIAKSPRSRYNYLMNYGVRLFSSFAHEWTKEIRNLIGTGQLNIHNICHYTFVWYDACATISEDDINAIKDMFTLRIFREHGPSIFGVTVSGRRKGDSLKKATVIMDAQVKKLAYANGYSLVKCSMNEFRTQKFLTSALIVVIF